MVTQRGGIRRSSEEWRGHDNLDAENSECQNDSDEPFRKKKRTRVDKQNSELYFGGYAADDCVENYPSELDDNGFFTFYRNRVRLASGSRFVQLHASGPGSG